MAVLNWIPLQMQDRMTLSEDFMRERIDHRSEAHLD